MEKNIIKRIVEYFSDEDDQNPSFVRVIRGMLLVVIVATFALLIMFSIIDQKVVARSFMAYLAIGLIIELFTLYSVQRGSLLLAKLLIPIVLLITVMAISLIVSGLRNVAMVAFPIIIIIGSILLKTKSRIINLLVLGAIALIAVKDLRGEIPSTPTNIIAAINLTILVLGFIGVTNLLVGRLNESIMQAQNSEKIHRLENVELNKLRNSLEERVNQRTSELELANRYNERRARQFEAISQVSRAINQTQGLQDLLPQITQVISQQFNFYHIGIFLLDPAREYATLVASNSEGGQKMLARNHKLKIGQVGIVGYVASAGAPRIALDTGADAIYFNNPDLPETRSEMALPLFRSGEELIGIIDVQSTEQNAFGQDDIQILTTLADQVSIAIVNARLYEDTQKALLESEMLYHSNIQTGWAKFTRSQKIAGIRRQGMKSDLLLEPIKLPGAAEVTRLGGVYQKKPDSNDKSTQTTIPMKLRGEVVGMLNIKTDDGRTWSADEMDIITAIVERAALSIENARLLTESRNAAKKERVIGEISAKINASTQIEMILKTAVRELGSQIGDAQISVEIGSNNE
jgi:GAF domain-containing protein